MEADNWLLASSWLGVAYCLCYNWRNSLTNWIHCISSSTSNFKVLFFLTQCLVQCMEWQQWMYYENMIQCCCSALLAILLMVSHTVKACMSITKCANLQNAFAGWHRNIQPLCIYMQACSTHVQPKHIEAQITINRDPIIPCIQNRISIDFIYIKIENLIISLHICVHSNFWGEASAEHVSFLTLFNKKLSVEHNTTQNMNATNKIR